MSKFAGNALVALAVVAALFPGVQPASAEAEKEGPCLKCRVKGFVKAMAQEDRDKAMSYLADEYTFRVVGSDLTMDRKSVASALDWNFATNAKVSYEDLQWEGDTVTGVFTETSDLYALLGLSPRRHRMTFRFEGDRIKEHTAALLDPEGPSFEEVIEPFLAWVAAEHPRDLEEIYPDGRFVYNGEAARRWIELLGAWRAQGS